MSEKRVAAFVILIVSSVFIYIVIMVSIPYGGIPFLFSHPSLFLLEIILPFIAFCVSLFWFVRLTRSQAPRRATYSSRDFDAHEVFQQIRSGTIPADWSVFQAQRKRVIDRSLIQSGMLLFETLLLGLLIWQGQIDGAPLYKIYFWAFFPCLLFIAAILMPVFSWKKAKNQILVVMSEGFIQGDVRKPQATLRVKYRDSRGLYVVGGTVKIFAKDDLEALNVSFASLPKEASAVLLAAFMRYKAYYPDVMLMPMLSP
jgi:hypothetical protein